MVNIDEVIERAEADVGDARTRLGRLFGLASFSDELLRIDLAVRDLSRRDQTAAEVRSMLAFSLWVGSHFIAADHALTATRTCWSWP